MYGYLKARPTKRDVFSEEQHQVARKSASSLAVNPQSTGYLSWEGISYFFGRLWTNGLYGGPTSPPPNKKLVETQVDSDLIKEQKRKDLLGLLGAMENTMEYTVTSYDTLPKIALKFDATPSQLSRLNKLAIRTLYPGQMLRVPCPKPTEPCAECSQADKVQTDAPQVFSCSNTGSIRDDPYWTSRKNSLELIELSSINESMKMDHYRDEMGKIPVAKRVSFEDIDEDVLETFIKVKSKYITDGQGVVKGFLLITPHAMIFHPDVSEILVVDQGCEYYKVHFKMRNVCSAGMFDDIASMVVHEALQPGHFFLDKPLMQWLDDPNTKSLEEIEEEDSSSTLHPSTDPSISQEQSMESLSETTESIQEGAPVPACTLDSAAMDITSGVLKETDTLQTSAQGISLEMDTTSGVLKDISQGGEINLENKDKLQSSAEEINLEHDLQDKSVASSNEIDLSLKTESLEQDLKNSEHKNLNEMSTEPCSISAENATENSVEMSSEQAKKNSVETSNDPISSDSICNDDVILSSSQYPDLANDNVALPDENEQLTSTEPSLQMYSTPKLAPYQDVGGEHMIEMDKEGYREGISRDSGIHESEEDVHEDTDDHRWIDRHDDALSQKNIVPRPSAHYEDMPKYLCVKIKKSCWREHRPTYCRYAHKAIQQATDERREFWFSIPNDRLLEVYGFFLEWCPAIHDGDTDDDDKSEDEFVDSLDSDYSVITIPKEDEESFELVDNFFSSSPGKENVQNNRPNKNNRQKRRTHNREKKKKKKPEPVEQERRASSWSMCSMEEPMMPEVIGKSEILTDAHILQLSQCLPSRTIGHSWHLIYSTYLHGISLKTLYRTLAAYDTPALLVILDDSRQAFGAFASSPFAMSEHFYGTGECLLYTFHPHFKVFRWSGENNFFIKGDTDSLALGGGQGNFGLWLDEDLYHGSSHCCKTFNNEPLTVKEDFLCSGVEIWCFE